MVTFHNFSVMGLLPPFFDFSMAVLEAFGLHMLHLHPNALLVLATFTHVCEAFIVLAFSDTSSCPEGGDRDG